MIDYSILIDANSDLTFEMATELGVEALPLGVTCDGKDFLHYLDGRNMSTRAFFDELRAGKTVTTVAINPTQWEDAMRKVLVEGKDVLVLVFSSGLSATYNSASIAANDLLEEYPDRKILVVDTLCASLGEGLLCNLVAKKAKAGATIEEAYAFAEDNKLKVSHWFTVDDLQFLKRGGRISGVAATMGTLLQIKPVLKVDNEGHLIPDGKVRGRKAALNALVSKLEEHATDPQSQEVFISHGDCLEDALYVKEQIMSKFNVQAVHINAIGPPVGAHSGPGTVALFFLAEQR